MGWVTKMFDKSHKSSKSNAKQRLKLVLMHDRAAINPATLELIKGELLEVIKKYVDIDTERTEIELNQDHRAVALIASIPVKSVREKALH